MDNDLNSIENKSHKIEYKNEFNNACSTCSICFCDYTASGSHRIVSLKCGHIFGEECISKWISCGKKQHCPTCSAPVRKIHLRPIFATEISATDNLKELELIEKLHLEQEKVSNAERIIRELKAEIDILKMTILKTVEPEKEITYSIPKKFIKECKLMFFPEQSFIEYDSISGIILISCKKINGEFGVYKYLISDTSINSFIKFESKINYMEMSPFNDGICILIFGKKIIILNVLNENILYEKEFSNLLTSACFDPLNRDCIFVGDFKGNLYYIKIFENIQKVISLFNTPINNICVIKNKIYALSIFSIKICDNIIENDLFYELEIEKKGIFVGMEKFKNTILLSIRDKNNGIYFYLTGNREIQMYSGIVQFKKLHNRIYGKNLYAIDNKCLSVLNIDNFQSEHKFNMEDEIVDFIVKNDYLLILSKKRLYIYGVK